MVPDKHNLPSSRDDHSNWIAEVSHELSLPLANIKLLVETLLSGAVDEPATARRMLARADEEVSRLQNLVSDLLSHEKLSKSGSTTGTMVLVLHKVEAALETTLPLARAKNITVRVEVEEGTQFCVDGDQLHQVLVNLLENAIKFTGENGLVTVRASRTPLKLEVEDTGIGIAESEIPKIFQRFYRVDRSKTRGSTGLGLTIVKHIVDLHGAKISVNSREGEGTCFIIEFPQTLSESGIGG